MVEEGEARERECMCIQAQPRPHVAGWVVAGTGFHLGNHSALPQSHLAFRPLEGYRVSICQSLRHPMDCSPLGSSVHGISKARILEWVAISFSILKLESRGFKQHLFPLRMCLPPIIMSRQGGGWGSWRAGKGSKENLYHGIIIK